MTVPAEFAGSVGVTQVGEHIWLVTFMHYDLGYFDDETCRRSDWTLENWLGALDDLRNWLTHKAA
jgi:hypothetical protein